MDQHTQIEDWFIAYSQDIYHYLVYFTGNSDVEDLVQEVFIRAIKRIDNFQYHSSPKTWLFSIARNIAIDHQRRQKLIQWVPEKILEFYLPSAVSPEKTLELKEEIRDLYTVLNQLKKSYREVIILRGIQGLSIAETAEILNWSEAKVNVTLHRALKKVKSALTQDGKELLYHES